MAEEQQGQEKTEEATPRKREKAKQDGQVARSRELNSVALVTFGAAATVFVMPGLSEAIMALTSGMFERAGQLDKPLTEYLKISLLSAFFAILPLLVVLFVAGAASSVAMGGLVFSSKALVPKMNRLSPLKGFKRMFSKRSAVELAKSIAKFLLVSGVGIAALNYMFSDLLSLGNLPHERAIIDGLYYVAIAFLLVGLSLVVVAAIDVPFQIAEHAKQLRMTKQEVKEELKDVEGKPEVKARVRQLQQQVANRRMLEDVPTADVVITNPQHFAVALRYQSGVQDVPIVVAKGTDMMAMRIRELAATHNITQVQAPALARAVFFTTDAGSEIPEGLYLAVAQVLAYVYQLDAYQRDGGVSEPRFDGVDVPQEFWRDNLGRQADELNE